MDIGIEPPVVAKSVDWLLEAVLEASQVHDQKTLRLALDELAGLLAQPHPPLFAIQ